MSDPNATPLAFAPDLAASFDDDTPQTALPAVVAVVATAGASSLEGCLRSLLAQQYPELTTLVVNDVAVQGIPARVASIDPSVLILNRLGGAADEALGTAAATAGSERDAGDCNAASAYNELLGRVSGAPLLLLLRDDVALDPNAVRIMVEELFRSNAAIVGPKLVAADDVSLLIDVGCAIDHYGTPFSPLDPAERDQEQHDGVRDVFFVSERAMLVRADIFDALGGFDLACADSVAVDLAWRARLAGGRVLVAPDARGRVARQLAAAFWPPWSPRAATAGRIRACVKSDSLIGLVWSLPLSFVFTLLEAVAYATRRRANVGGAILAGLWDAVRSAGALRSLRRSTQLLRVVEHGEYHVYMIRGNARIRTMLRQRLHVDERLADASLKTREALDDATGRFRHAELGVVALAVVLSLLSARGFVSGSVPNVGGFGDWQNMSHLWDLFTSGRRASNLGVDAFAPPMFGLMWLWSLVWFGNTALAHAVLIVGAGPIGIAATFRFLRRYSSSAWPPVAGAIVYAANPVLRNGIAAHRLSVVIAYATIPIIAALTFDVVSQREVALTGSQLRRRIAQLLLALLIVGSFAPILLALPLAILLSCCGSSVIVGSKFLDIRTATIRVVGVSVGALVALVPWSFNLFNGGGSSIGFATRPALSIVKIMSFQTGPNGAGALAIGVWASALLPLFVAPPEALRYAVSGWLLALAGVVAVVVSQHVDPQVQLPELEVLLSVSALGLALAVGVGVASVVSELRTFLFGFRQIVVVVGLVSILVPTVAWVGDVPDGRLRAAREDWATELSWMESEANVVGDFRVLWIGARAALPSTGIRAAGVDFAITSSAIGDVAELLAPEATALALVGESIQLARAGTTSRLGHLLAPMSIRYIAVVERPTPDSASVADPTGSLGSLNGQLDVSVLNANDGVHLYRNLAWAPRATLVGSNTEIPLGSSAARDPIDSAQRVELSAGKRLKNPADTGILLLSESFSDRWTATLNGKALSPVESFGWATAWRVPSSGTVRFHYAEPAWRWLVLGVQSVVFLVLVLLSLGANIPQRKRPARGVPTSHLDNETVNP